LGDPGAGNIQPPGEVCASFYSFGLHDLEISLRRLNALIPFILFILS
jgi:hypothetical protein